MDNLSTHTGEKVRQAIEARGCQLLFLPSYSPDFSPIEEAFSTLKAFAHADQVPVKRMIADLEKQGIRVWVDSEGLRPGTPDWEEAVRKAICTAKAVIFVASPEARSSPF